MSLPLVLACLWALAATVTAMLPMRRQFAPGIALLIAAPVLITWIAVRHGPIIAVIGVLAFLSMFRRPLVYLVRRALGLPTERPAEGLAERPGDAP